MSSALNYKHLHYFWVVAHEGSIAKASEKLHITPQTISGQLTLLEQQVASALFVREGRGLKLSETGRLVLRYADEIFELGRELTDVLRGAPAVGPSEFIVGTTSALPKTIVYRIVEPALKLDQDIKLTCREGAMDLLLADLALHKLDLVLSDTPITGAFSIKAYNHLLGESGITFFASPELVRRYKKGFPQSLNAAPLLVPTTQNAVRQAFNQWLEDADVKPIILGEFDDSALMKSFAQAGLGIFFMSSVIEDEVCKNFNVKILGRLGKLKQKFYAISVERKVKHPAVAAICDSARSSLF